MGLHCKFRTRLVLVAVVLSLVLCIQLKAPGSGFVPFRHLVSSTSSRHSPAYCQQPLQHRYNIQCERLISGDGVYMQSLTSLDVSRGDGSCNLSSLVTNCKDFTSRHGYYSNRVTGEEAEFPIAFGIKVHTDPVQVEQLLRAIYRPHNVYCIHVDLKSNKSVSDPLRMLAKCFDNVFVIQEYRVVYSSIFQTLSDIACMKKLISTNIKWKYYFILSGQEFFLKTNLEIVKILKILNGTNDVESSPFPNIIKFRINTKHKIIENRIKYKSEVPKTPFSYNVSLHKGSAYGMFSRPFVRFVLESKIAHELLIWLNDTYAPEETIWATLNAIPGVPGGYTGEINHNDRNFLSRAVIWSWDKPECLGKYVRSTCIFGYKDLPWLVSAPEIVANKFHSDFDQLVVDCLEEWLHNKTMSGETVNLNWFHYRNAPHVKHSNSK